ncbi:hypothetical protein [Avibacterium paragallinarum]|uniref:hypothetical protein n=1 Tax=Avibacterium paragallinarum TaxID=728 RepID=UPI003F5B247A
MEIAPKTNVTPQSDDQCARLAFGFTGIYDQDEAERIVENQKEPLNVTPKPNVIEGQAVELATSEQIDTLNQLIQLTNTDTEKAFAYYSVQSIEQLSKAKAEHFIKTLNGRLDESAQNDNNKASEEVPL